MKRKIILGLIIVAGLGVAGLYLLPLAYLNGAFTWAYRNPPSGCTDIAFNTQKIKSKTSCEVQVFRQSCYALYLTHKFKNSEDFVKIEALSSSKSNAKNPPQINVTIQQKTGNGLMERFSKVIIPPAITHWGKGGMSPLAGVNLSIGEYVITLESLKTNENYKFIKTNIDFEFCDKE